MSEHKNYNEIVEKLSGNLAQENIKMSELNHKVMFQEQQLK